MLLGDFVVVYEGVDVVLGYVCYDGYDDEGDEYFDKGEVGLFVLY